MASLTDIYTMPNLPTGGWMGGQPGYPDTTPAQPGRPLYGTNMPTIQPTAPLYGTNMPTIQPTPDGSPKQIPFAAPGSSTGVESSNSPAAVAPYYPEAQLSSGGWGFTLRNYMAKNFIEDLNAKVASGAMTQEQANQAWAQYHEQGNEEDRARETSARQFQQHGLTAVGAAATGGLLAGGIGGAAGAAASPTDVAPPLDATQDPLGSGGDPGNPAPSGSGGGGTAGGAGSALSRIIDGTATPADWTSVLGGVAGTGLGIAGSISQQNALKDLADKQMAMGAPYRDRLAALYADPNSFLKSAEVTTPVQQGTDALARSLSVQGNPIGSGHALQELQNYSANQLFGKLGAEKDRLAGYGGLTAYNAAAPGTSLAGVNAGSNVWNALGSGIANLTTPQPSLIDLYKAMKGLA